MSETIEVFSQRSYQKGLRLAYQNGYRRFVCLWHRRAGKDRNAMAFCLECMLQRVGVYYHIFPSLNQGRRDVWDNILQETKNGVERSFRMMEMFPGFTKPRNRGGNLLVQAADDQEMQIILLNGSVYQIVGADDEPAIERLRGPNPIGLVFSEYAHGSKMKLAWETLSPVLAQNGGWAIFAYTPKGQNHGEARFRIARANPDIWYCQKLTIDDTFRDADGEDGARVVSVETLAAERLEHREEWIQQEYFCDFTGFEHGTIYGDLVRRADDDGRIKDELPYIPQSAVGVCMDLGYSADAMALWFYQLIDGVIRWIDYEEATQKDMVWVTKLLHSKRYVYGRICLPWDGQAAMEYLTLAGFRNVVKVQKRTQSVQAEIEKVRRDFPRMVFNAGRCSRGLECLRNYARDYDEDKKTFGSKPIHNQWSHGADAMRTGFEAELTPLMFPGRESMTPINVITEFDPRNIPAGVA